MSRLRRALVLATTLLVFTCVVAPLHAQTPPAPWSGVVGRDGSGANTPWDMQHRSFRDAISGDGRYVVFKRGWDVNGWGDIYLRDRHTGLEQKINVAADGSEPPSNSDTPSISGNGKHVLFVSCGALMPDDLNGICDLYTRDVEHNTITRLTIGPGGEDLWAGATWGSISNDGRFVAYTAQFAPPYADQDRHATTSRSRPGR